MPSASRLAARPRGEQPDGVVGQHAVGAAAVGDDLGSAGEFGQARLEFLRRDGDGPGNVPRGVLRGRADVDHGGGAGLDPLQQLLAGEAVGVLRTEVRGARLLGRGQAVAGDRPIRTTGAS